MTNAHAGWPPPRRAPRRANDPAKGPDPRPVQRPNFTAIVNASRSAVHVHGELNVLTADLLRGAIAHLRAVGHDQITVDLTGLVCLDATAMRELGRLQHALRTENIVVIFLDMPRRPRSRDAAERRDQLMTGLPALQSPTTAPPIIAANPTRDSLRAVPTTGLDAATPPSQHRRPPTNAAADVAPPIRRHL